MFAVQPVQPLQDADHLEVDPHRFASCSALERRSCPSRSCDAFAIVVTNFSSPTHVQQREQRAHFGHM